MRKFLRQRLRQALDDLIEVEIIGQEDCPMMLRWTFANLGFLKGMVHYFPPNVSDRDPHDHPRPFLTFVLRGRYFDTSWEKYGDLEAPTIEMVEAGGIRYRPAKHMHIVDTDDRGAWTIVVMGPLVREWGFLRLSTGLWWEWGKYIQRFGGVMRCEEGPSHTVKPEDLDEPTYRDYKGSHPFG